jgi:hypothetical protein
MVTIQAKYLNGKNPFRDAAEVLEKDGWTNNYWHKAEDISTEDGWEEFNTSAILAVNGRPSFVFSGHCAVGALRMVAGELSSEPEWHERARLFCFAVTFHGIEAMEIDEEFSYDDKRNFDRYCHFDNNGDVTLHADKKDRQYGILIEYGGFNHDVHEANPLSLWNEQRGRNQQEVIDLLTMVGQKLDAVKSLRTALQAL